jgi:quinol monooxygenase YgiN
LVYVIATVQVRPNMLEHLAREFRTVAAEVRAEHGCLEYCATIDVDSGLARQSPLRADVVTVVERWKDIAALAAHSTTPHMQAFRKRIADYVGATSLQVLAPV